MFKKFADKYIIRYYNSLPPVAKTYATICFATTGAYQLGLYYPDTIALVYKDVFKQFQVNFTSSLIFFIYFYTNSATCNIVVVQIWRLITNFFFLGPFSLPFAFHLLMM